MATNVHLTRELEAFARSCVEGGMYNNVSEVVRSGLRLLKEREDRRRAFDAMIARAVRETDENGARTMDDVLGRDEEIAEERAFIRAVHSGLADIEAGREVSLAEVKAKFGIG